MNGSPTLLRFGIAAVVLLIFTDVLYVAYYNSFYSDTAAFLSLLWMYLFAIAAVAKYRTWYIYGFAVAAMFFVTSKTQHALDAWIPGLFLVWIGWKARPRVSAILAALVVIAGALEIASTPAWVKGMTAFDVVFHQIAVDRKSGVVDLKDLGLDSNYDQYIGQYAYQPNSPALNQDWSTGFSRVVGYCAIARFYLRHPLRTIDILDTNVRENAIVLRPIGNFCLGDGYPPRAIAHRFAVWSGLKTGLLRCWPEALVMWYACFVLVAGMILFKAGHATRRNAAVVALSVSILGVQEFVVATLADAAETSRHLFLFHACTDLMICLAVAGSMTWLGKQWRKAAAEPHLSAVSSSSFHTDR